MNDQVAHCGSCGCDLMFDESMGDWFDSTGSYGCEELEFAYGHWPLLEPKTLPNVPEAVAGLRRITEELA